MMRAARALLGASVAAVVLASLKGCAAQTIVDLLPLKLDAAVEPPGPTLPEAAAGTSAPSGSDAADDSSVTTSALPMADAASDDALAFSTATRTDAGVLPPAACLDAARGGPTIPALYFGGSGARVEIQPSNQLNFSTEFAIEAWIFLCSNGGGPVILSEYVLAAEDKYVGIDPVNQAPEAWFLVPDDMPTVVSTAPLSLASWHHVAISAGSGSLRLFVDGKSMATAPFLTPAANASAPLYIGTSMRVGWTASIDGYIADVRLSSKNRYPANFAPPATLAVDSATVALWPLDEGAGTIATDRGTAGLNGAIAGGVSWVRAPAR